MNANASAAPVTVLGLGAMGTALAGAFLDAGHPTTVWNRTPDKAAPLVARGATHAPTVAEAVRAAPLVVVCLLNDATVRETVEPAAEALAGRTLVNLTTGTPAQARRSAAWAADRGIGHLDGGIMATPPMIARPGSLLLYAGDQTAFETHRTTLERLGAADYLGADAGTASLLDLAMLTGMYGMFGGFLHAVALARTGGVKASEFTVARLVPWLTAMLASLPEMARQVDAGPTGTAAVDHNLAMQAAGYVTLMQTSREQGLGTELIAPMQRLLDRAVARDRGGDDLASLVGLLAADAEV